MLCRFGARDAITVAESRRPTDRILLT